MNGTRRLNKNTTEFMLDFDKPRSKREGELTPMVVTTISWTIRKKKFQKIKTREKRTTIEKTEAQTDVRYSN